MALKDRGRRRLSVVTTMTLCFAALQPTPAKSAYTAIVYPPKRIPCAIAAVQSVPGFGTLKPKAVTLSQDSQPHLRVIEPQSSLDERRRLQIIWGIVLVLLLLCYVTILAAFRALKHLSTRVNSVERSIETLASLPSEADTAIRTVAQILRPWIAISFEPVRGKDGIFGIVAVNRGISPAQLVGTIDRIGVLSDESCLPATPEFARGPRAPASCVVLIPGDSALLQTFGRTDLSWICKTPDQLRRIELGQDKVIIYGRVLYRAPAEISGHGLVYETGWCCRYLYSETGGTLINSGSQEYRKHT